jgi:hypothetical protein
VHHVSSVRASTVAAGQGELRTDGDDTGQRYAAGQRARFSPRSLSRSNPALAGQPMIRRHGGMIEGDAPVLLPRTSLHMPSGCGFVLQF